MNADLIPLICSAAVLELLASSLRAFAPTGGPPDWLLTGVWLDCCQHLFLATPSIDVLEDGFLARPLVIEGPEAAQSGIEEALPDIQARLLARGSHVMLPDSFSLPEPPKDLTEWPGELYSLFVLLRVAQSANMSHRIACALLFKSKSGRRLLLGTDRTTLAMVLSEDDDLIDLYCSECEEISVADYRQLAGI